MDSHLIHNDAENALCTYEASHKELFSGLSRVSSDPRSLRDCCNITKQQRREKRRSKKQQQSLLDCSNTTLPSKKKKHAKTIKLQKPVGQKVVNFT
ncbi:hypothetical protein Peur_006543 [Populus x canadensis]